MVGVPQQDGQDLHAGRPGLALPLLLGPLQGALAVDGVLTHLRPGRDSVAVLKLEVRYVRTESVGFLCLFTSDIFIKRLPMKAIGTITSVSAA